MKSDAQLIDAARTDPDAFGELYRKHVRAVHAFFRSRAPQQAAGELTAETFAQAALSLRRFRDETGGSALPWLYGIAQSPSPMPHKRARRDSRELIGCGLAFTAGGLLAGVLPGLSGRRPDR